MHEAQMHNDNVFVTLTYDDDNYNPSLSYPDFQRFMYRLRSKFGPTRFFVAGEYGEATLRPHFHALLFGRTFTDRYQVGENLYGSTALSKLWPYGFSSFGSVTYQSAAYCAKYACKKITGPKAEAHYTRVDFRTGEYVRVVPEMGHMSLKPGLGYSWFLKYWKEVYRVRDGIVRPGGFVVPPPRYYDKLLSDMDGALLAEKEFDRYVNSQRFKEDCSPRRLLDREVCALAKRKMNRSRL